ncbi:MAG: CHASE domain-containing protein [Acidobacteria bacterium]|nr:CHASE domain-containing protein [Acidobacteriota bacterium]
MTPLLAPRKKAGFLPALVLLLTGMGLSLAGFLQVRANHRHQVLAEFDAAARERMEAIQRELLHGQEAVLSLRDHLGATERLDEASFRAFAGPLAARHPYLQALQWLPELRPEDRARIEGAARERGGGLRFFTRGSMGETQNLPPTGNFFAVLFVEPLRGNEAALGYSAHQVETRQLALRRALETGEASATGPLKLIQEPGRQLGFLLMVPLPAAGVRPRGVVQGVFRAGDMVHKSIAFLSPRGVDLTLLSSSPSEGRAVLHQEGSRQSSGAAAEETGLRTERSFGLAGRTWTVEARAAPGHFQQGGSGAAWGLLLGGLAGSGLLAGLAKSTLERSREVQVQVEARTEELQRETENHRKDAEDLRRSRARYRDLVELMEEGMWALNRQGVGTFVNRRLVEMLGYGREEILGRPLEDFLHPQASPAVRRGVEALLQGLRTREDIHFQRRDGTELWAIATSTSGADSAVEGEEMAGGALIILTDVTERRRVEASQREAQKLESLGVLAGGIAHDFNNLLGAILGNLNLAQLHVPEGSPALPFLDNIERSVSRATALTLQMLAYSGRGKFTLAPLDLNLAVGEITHLLSVSMSKKIRLAFDLRKDLPLVLVDPSQIQQVVMNLVTNAAEAIGDREGTVTIRTATQELDGERLARDFPGQGMDPGLHVLLEVKDTGQGMTPEVQARIFEPFFTTKFAGRGLGLSALQGILRAHRAGVLLHSDPGKGTSFSIFIPAISSVDLEEEAIREQPWTSEGRILVVDDEPAVRTAASDLLAGLGFEVVQAGDGEEAVGLFGAAREPFRAVLMDLTMPRMGGLEAARQIRARNPQTPVLFISGFTEQELLRTEDGVAPGAFLQKPFNRASLIRSMRELLGE